MENYTLENFVLIDVEKEYIKKYDGFDFYYAYTDDVSVYRAAEKHHNELKEQGDKMIADKVRLKFINENTRNLLHKLKDQLKDQEKDKQ